MMGTLSRRLPGARAWLHAERRQAAFYLLILLLPLPAAIYCIGLGRYAIPPEEVVRALLDFALGRHDASAGPDIVYNHALEVQLAAFFFGLVAVMLAYSVSRLYHSAPLLVLTLVGILVGSFFSSLTSLLKYVADPLDTLPAITYWLMGGLTDVTLNDIPALAVISMLGMVALWGVRWRLNVLSMGDNEALALGLNPTRLKLLIIICSTLMTAMAVSVGGVIGWVGLVIPHAARTLVGPDHQRLIPATMALGAVFLLLIDTMSRTLLPAEVPLGVFTGVVGVPLLLIILRVNRTGWR